MMITLSAIVVYLGMQNDKFAVAIVNAIVR